MAKTKHDLTSFTIDTLDAINIKLKTPWNLIPYIEDNRVFIAVKLPEPFNLTVAARDRDELINAVKRDLIFWWQEYVLKKEQLECQSDIEFSENLVNAMERI